MRASIVIAAHNEGDLLWRTVRSCIESTAGLGYEIVVADDASTDGSLENMRRSLERWRERHPGIRPPTLRLFAHRKRRGVSPTKDLGARNSRGKVLLFLDGHCKTQRGAVRRLVEDVEELDGQAIVTPRIPHLDSESWTCSPYVTGYGFCMDLKTFDCGWARKSQMRRFGRFYESPALIGCCVALSRKLYARLLGFDRRMRDWGVEDIDFGLKAWLLGHPTLLDAAAVIGHRFRVSFDTFSVAEENVLFNKLRMARKNFTDAVWRHWVECTRPGVSQAVWGEAWELYSRERQGLERERRYLFARRARDEFAYAERFGLGWPRARS